MADQTDIEWARHPVTGRGATWNPITGCSVVSPGCTNCYAMRLAGTRLRHHASRKGLTKPSKAGPVWTGETRFNAEWLTQPLKWRTPRGIFVAAHGDLFAEGVTDAQLDQIFAVMALAPQHIFFVLTKRPERMRDYLTAPLRARWIYEAACDMTIDQALPVALIADPSHEAMAPVGFPRIYLDVFPLPNVWLGVSVEDQPRADERIPILLDTPAAIRFISAEPVLALMDISKYLWPVHPWWDAKYKSYQEAKTAGGRCGVKRQALVGAGSRFLDWVIAGGESGPNARPSPNADCFQFLRDQCAAAETAFFFKQWGEWIDWREVSSGYKNCSRFDRLGNVTEARARMHFPYKNGFVQPEGDFPWRGNMIRVGKKAAGHTLDGVEHLAFPRLAA